MIGRLRNILKEKQHVRDYDGPSKATMLEKAFQKLVVKRSPNNKAYVLKTTGYYSKYPINNNYLFSSI